MVVGAVLAGPACGSKGLDVSALCPTSNPRRLPSSPSFSSAQFCQLYFATCVGSSAPMGGYSALADCEGEVPTSQGEAQAYPALAYETTRQCRSYHLCNAAAYDTGAVTVHCRHSVGIDLCADTPTGQQ